MTALPRISVVTPSFNQGKFLEETICSVLDQEYPNLEYVIIDGGSKDRSVEIIRKYERHLAYWVSEPDSGHGNALNKGFKRTTGEIMAWINSDDKYLPWTFDVVSEAFTTFPDVQWIVGNNAWWDGRGRLMEARTVLKNRYDFLLGNYAWIQQESAFWRRDLWSKAGGYIDESYRFMVDGELWSRFFRFERLWHVNYVIGGYRAHDANRAKSNMERCRAEMDRAIAELRRAMPHEVQADCRKFRRIRFLKGKLRFLSGHLERWARRTFGTLYERASYGRLIYSEGRWRKAFEEYAC